MACAISRSSRVGEGAFGSRGNWARRAPRARRAGRPARAGWCRRRAAGPAPARSCGLGEVAAAVGHRAVGDLEQRLEHRDVRWAGAERAAHEARRSQRALQPAADVEERQPWPRVMFSISMPLNAARSVIIRFRCTSTSSSWMRPCRSRKSCCSWLRMRQVSSESRSRTVDAIRRTSLSVDARRPGCASSLNSSDSCLLELAAARIGSRSSGGQQLDAASTCEQRRRAPATSSAVSSRVRQHDEAAQQAHRLLGPLGVAAEPEQVVGDAARQLGVAALAPHAEARRRQQRHRADRAVGQHPGVLAAAAALHRHDRHVAGRADAREPAGHHRCTSRRPTPTYDAQHERARLELLAVPHRRGRERDLLLRRRTRPGARSIALRSAAFCSALSVAAEHRLSRRRRKRALDRPARRGARGRTADSSGWPHHHVRAGRQQQLLAEQMAARVRAGTAASAGVSTTPLPSALATATLPARTASTSPATPSDESPRSSSGSQKPSSSRRRITSTGAARRAS